MPPKDKSFNKEVKELANQKVDNQNSYWILFQYGRSYWSIRESRVFKESYFLNSSIKSYNMNNWNFDTMVLVSFPEEKSFVLPQGSIFDRNGKYISSPTTLDDRIYEIPNVTLSNDGNFRKNKGFYKLLSDSDYPIYKDEDERFYNRFPYFSVTKTYYELKDIIIPTQVILAYFYNLSPLCLYHVLYGTFIKGMRKPYIKNDKYIVPYDSNIIAGREMMTLAKYYFTTNNSGFKAIESIHSNFFESLVNDKEKGKGRFYIDGRLPIDYPIKVNVIGQYIDSNKEGEDPQKFLVHRIDRASTIGEQDFFTINEFEVLDLKDKRSTKDGKDQNHIGYTGVNSQENIGDGPENSDSEVNTLIKIKETKTEGLSLFFTSPEVKKVDKYDQKNKYILENVIDLPVDSYGDNYSNTNTNSTTRRANIINYEELNTHFEILKDALKILSTEGYEITYLKLKNHNGIYSDSPVYNDMVDKLIIVQIGYEAKSYCIVDSGYGKSIGMFCYNDKFISFVENEDKTIRNIIVFMIKKMKFQWVSAQKKQVFNNDGIKVLESLKHSLSFKTGDKEDIDFDKSVISLADRIKKRIIKENKNLN